MKKALISPLCSGLVIPGLGQIINQEIKKGILLLAGVFILFVALVVRLYKIVSAAVHSGLADSPEPALLIKRFISEDSLILWLLLAAASLLWLFSVVDALIGGLKADRAGDIE